MHESRRIFGLRLRVINPLTKRLLFVCNTLSAFLNMNYLTLPVCWWVTDEWLDKTQTRRVWICESTNLLRKLKIFLIRTVVFHPTAVNTVRKIKLVIELEFAFFSRMKNFFPFQFLFLFTENEDCLTFIWHTVNFYNEIFKWDLIQAKILAT